MTSQFINSVLRFFYPPVKRLLPYQVYAYLAVGAANTLLNIGLFMASYLAFARMQLAVELATVISFLVTVLTGFWLSKNFAFTHAGDGKQETRKQFSRYFLVSLQGQFSDYLITKALILFLWMNPTLAYLVSTGIMLILNYFLQKYYTFRNRKATVVQP